MSQKMPLGTAKVLITFVLNLDFLSYDFVLNDYTRFGNRFCLSKLISYFTIFTLVDLEREY